MLSSLVYVLAVMPSSDMKKLHVDEAKKPEYGEIAKFVHFVVDEDDDGENSQNVNVVINENEIEKAKSLAGYSVFVTSEIKMSAMDICFTYYNMMQNNQLLHFMNFQLNIGHLQTKK